MTTPFDGDQWGAEFARLVKDYCAKIETRLRDEFEKRFVALEEAGPKFKGVYVEGLAYSKGAMVIHGGSLWHCNALETSSRPGQDGNWTLSCKSGMFSK